MLRILLTDALDADAESRLAAAAEVVRPASRDETTLCAAVADCDAIVAKTSTPITRRILESGKRLRVLGVAGVGLDKVDEATASELGIEVVHAPAAASDAVAELTLALILQLLRPIARLAEHYRHGHFAEARREPHGVELCDQTVGILGCGRIGSRVARIATGFGCRAIYHDIRTIDSPPAGARCVDAETLWRESDIVSLHVPLTRETRGLADAARIATMRRGALLINTCRGSVVRTDALLAALASGQLGGAGLDVVDPEPLPVGHPLFSMANCLLTPHIAARTHAGLRRMNAVVDDVLAALRRELKTG
ncbi:MAG: NAD(P)-dependent oxidoreductase [Phycisphaerae bacterium]